MNIKTFRDNLFMMNTRRFGKVTELLVQKLTGYEMSNDLAHDLELNGFRAEVKFSRVFEGHGSPVTHDNVLETIESEGVAVRIFPYGEYADHEFDCNIQQVKKDQFEWLFYGLLFADRVLVFMIPSDEIGENVGYSDKQHRGNQGEGQFHITQDNLKYHMDTYLFATLSYTDLMTLLEP